MPSALVFLLRPQHAATTHAHLGRAAHAAVLRLIGASSPHLAQQIHDGIGQKPLTVSTVGGLAARGQTALVDPAQQYRLRVTLLTPELERVAADWQAADLPPFDLDGLLWQVEGLARTSDAHAWAGAHTFEELAAPALGRASAPPRRWELEFVSPVTFRQRGMNAPLPTPDLVFGSLLEKWNTCSTVTLPDEVRRYATECLAVSRFDLQSASVPAKGTGLQVGAVGVCGYTATVHDRYWMACIDLLAQFAFYSGVGAATTRGLGQTRLRG